MAARELLAQIPHTIAFADVLVAWLATYALHSTMFILTAIAVTSRWAPWRLGTAMRDLLWKSALIGGLVTATLQVAADATPVFGTWTPRAAAKSGAVNVRVMVASGDIGRAVPGRPGAVHGVTRPAPSPDGIIGRPEATSSITLPPISVHSPGRPPVTVFAGFSMVSTVALTIALLWLTMAAWMIGCYDRGSSQLIRFLADRRPAGDGIAGRALREVARRAGVDRAVRLSSTDWLESPAVIGSDEICVPRRFLSEVTVPQQEGILAHELAHVVRHDAWWLRVANLIVHVFFFQPLNRVARSRLTEVAEFAADEWAVQTMGEPLHLARGLAVVASWLTPATRSTTHPAMASARGSVLVQRISRLTSAHEMKTSRCNRWTQALTLAACLAATALVPRIELSPAWPTLGEGRLVFQERIERSKGSGVRVRMVNVAWDSIGVPVAAFRPGAHEVFVKRVAVRTSPAPGEAEVLHQLAKRSAAPGATD